MTRFSLSIAILACSLATDSIAAQPQVHYRLTQIVPEAPTSSILAADLNDRGQVVGFVQDSSGRDHAFAWRDGTLTNLGPLIEPTSTRTRATGNNDRGDIVAFFFFPQSDAFASVLLRQSGEVTRFDGLPGGATFEGLDINDRRQVIGNSFLDDGSSQAFIWEDGNFMQLPPLPGDTSATVAAFNERGDALGTSTGTTGHVVIWEDGAAVDLQIPGAVARDINDREQVTGTLQRQGFLWERGTLVQLPSLADAVITQAVSINNAGEIVGTSGLTNGARATLWDEEQVFDLNDLIHPNDPLRAFVSLGEALSINDRGAIAVRGRDSRAPTELRTYLLTPVH